MATEDLRYCTWMGFSLTCVLRSLKGGKVAQPTQSRRRWSTTPLGRSAQCGSAINGCDNGDPRPTSLRLNVALCALICIKVTAYWWQRRQGLELVFASAQVDCGARELWHFLPKVNKYLYQKPWTLRGGARQACGWKTLLRSKSHGPCSQKMRSSTPSLLTRAVVALLLLLRFPALAQTDFSTTSGLSTWNQSEWSLTATRFIPGQFQARASLANG
jgi:hypothetical protein